ncbi:MAG: DUF2817 domain-containing protein [Anaerolineae bacterium]|nr:DUF2817 domain-containing protein [Anaerolineae bacterium]
MLQPGMLLQDRYHITRQLGSGGMGKVYMAEDSRLPGRRCAIKEMLPDQLAAQDRNWAIGAFQQEAQMLANLKHSGLAGVTDCFAEYGNWYLAMDYIEGETLDDYLTHMPGGRLPAEEAVRIIRQLCEVLNYLHNQNPPVIFRDLKPGNVMLTPQGEVKLIDFGIARFFKSGQTRDTVNLGTPGYAAPEQYGKLGLQSGPRSDVYSLGVLLLQMVTGYDPTITPFPLPEPRSVMRNIPPHIAAVITQATYPQPEARYGSVREMQQALFPPTYPLPPQAGPAAPSHPARPNWLLPVAGSVGTIVVLAICAVIIWASGLLPISPSTPAPDPVETVAPTTAPAATYTALPETKTEPPAIELVPPSAEPTQTPTRTPHPTATPIPTAAPVSVWSDLGKSVKGRNLSMLTMGYEGGTSVVIVGSIQGDQSRTSDLVQAVIDNFERNLSQIPQDVAFYFIPSINPDGNAANTRFNANDVDLNRNWDTADWTSNAAVPGYPSGKAGAGGSRPFSEPETQALSSLLLQLQRSSKLRVVILHTSVSSPNEVFAGDDDAKGIASTFASAMGYSIEDSWGAYTPTGEVITWCGEEDIISIDVIIPANSTPSVDKTVRALLNVAQY